MKTAISLSILLFLVSPLRASGQDFEPLYEGKPASYWMLQLTNRLVGDFLSQLKTNTVPVLLRAVNIRGDGEEAGAMMAATIRTNAALLLAGRADQATLGLLATNHFDPKVRAIVLQIFEMDPGRRATDILVNALSDSDPDIRRVVLFGLSLTARELNRRDLETIAGRLQDVDLHVRTSAAQTLYWYSNSHYPPSPAAAEAAFPEILGASSNRDVSISRAAQKSLMPYWEYLKWLKTTNAAARIQVGGRIFGPGSAAVLRDFAAELLKEMGEADGKEWEASVKAVDENGHELQNAKITILYYVPQLVSSEGNHGIIEGTTDTAGKFVTSHKDVSGWLGITARKEGYADAGTNCVLLRIGSNGHIIEADRHLKVTLVLIKAN